MQNVSIWTLWSVWRSRTEIHQSHLNWWTNPSTECAHSYRFNSLMRLLFFFHPLRVHRSQFLAVGSICTIFWRFYSCRGSRFLFAHCIAHQRKALAQVKTSLRWISTRNATGARISICCKLSRWSLGSCVCLATSLIVFPSRKHCYRVTL